MWTKILIATALGIALFWFGFYFFYLDKKPIETEKKQPVTENRQLEFPKAEPGKDKG